MALEPIALKALLMEVASGHPLKLLSLGYPDILYDGTGFKDIPERKDAAQIRSWHNWQGRVLDTDTLFEALDITPTYIDAAKVRGPEILSDLNIEGRLEGTEGGFNIILDPGTIEHVFNIGNAFSFIASACAMHGVVIHTNPLNMGNHGFWCLQPTAYIDWYEANGFVIEAMMELSGPVSARKARKMGGVTGRFDASPNSTMFVVARKVKEKATVTFPVQTKYRLNPSLKGAA